MRAVRCPGPGMLVVEETRLPQRQPAGPLLRRAPNPRPPRPHHLGWFRTERPFAVLDIGDREGRVLVRDVGALATAARCAGVPVSEAREWRARGFGNDPNKPRTAGYAFFAEGGEKARGEFVARRIRRIEQAAEGGTWTADAWAVERVDPDTWGRRDRLDVSGTITVVEMRAFFVAVVGLLERYVPPERLEAELANLIAVTDEIAGGMPDRAMTR